MTNEEFIEALRVMLTDWIGSVPVTTPGIPDVAVPVGMRVFVDEELENEGAFDHVSYMLGNQFFFDLWVLNGMKINEASGSEKFYIIPNVQPSGFAQVIVGSGYVHGKTAGQHCTARWVRHKPTGLWAVQLVYGDRDGKLQVISKRRPWTWNNASQAKGTILLPPRFTE